MSLIRNLIKEDKQPLKKKSDDGDKDEEKPAVRQIKSATDLQRFKLEKLMKNPNKAIEIPFRKSDSDYMKTVPDFVRNVMGSSAGAGSGEFHVYRHLRRKEYSRQKVIEAKSKREELDQEYQDKLDDNKRKADERTAKKRAKRLKKKAKKPRVQNNDKGKQDTKLSEAEEPSSEEEEENDEAKETVEDSQQKVIGVLNKTETEDNETAEKIQGTEADDIESKNV